uniref:Uncharacterized protein n=1 Tax=Pipistrellus kuhlii TaxID=59472 RepID=A0A7J7RGP8_PIPKU|nr:hypothetical protein mPipKuh1_010551 [Pipistrellus kuhlii]
MSPKVMDSLEGCLCATSGLSTTSPRGGPESEDLQQPRPGPRRSGLRGHRASGCSRTTARHLQPRSAVAWFHQHSRRIVSRPPPSAHHEESLLPGWGVRLGRGTSWQCSSAQWRRGFCAGRAQPRPPRRVPAWALLLGRISACVSVHPAVHPSDRLSAGLLQATSRAGSRRRSNSECVHQNRPR